MTEGRTELRHMPSASRQAAKTTLPLARSVIQSVILEPLVPADGSCCTLAVPLEVAEASMRHSVMLVSDLDSTGLNSKLDIRAVGLFVEVGLIWCEYTNGLGQH